MGVPVYATREQVKSALDSATTARDNRKVDRLIRASSRMAEKLTLRKFYPTYGTRTFDWPDEFDTPATWRLWLDENELVALDSAASGGTTLAVGTYFARPDTGPPFTHVEINRSTSSSWSVGSTPQRGVSLTGTFGFQVDEVTGPDLAANITSSAPTCTVGATADIGVGSLIRIGTERMNVTGRSMLTTGQTLQVPITAEDSATSVRVSNGALYVEDEVIMLDSEKMRIDEITGNTLTVKRRWDGTVLAAHTGSTVYAPRTLTIERGQCGSTAASHTSGDDVVWTQFPALVNAYVIAETLASMAQESSAYARVTGAGDNERETAGKALADVRARLKRGYYRTRLGAV